MSTCLLPIRVVNGAFGNTHVTCHGGVSLQSLPFLFCGIGIVRLFLAPGNVFHLNLWKTSDCKGITESLSILFHYRFSGHVVLDLHEEKSDR